MLHRPDGEGLIVDLSGVHLQVVLIHGGDLVAIQVEIVVCDVDEIRVVPDKVESVGVEQAEVLEARHGRNLEDVLSDGVTYLLESGFYVVCLEFIFLPS